MEATKAVDGFLKTVWYALNLVPKIVQRVVSTNRSAPAININGLAREGQPFYFSGKQIGTTRQGGHSDNS